MRMTILTLIMGTLMGSVSAEAPPLIPRAVLFGNPDRASPQISPDGKRLAYRRADEKNVMQVWVRTVGQNDDRVITADPKRGISTYFWAYDNKHLLYLQDSDGDENYHLFATDLETKQTRDLSPHKGVRVQGVELDKKFPTELLVGMNKRNKQLFDMYRINLVSGEEKLDTENPGNAIGYTTDADFKIRACTVAKMTGGFELKVRDAVDKPWRTMKSLTSDEEGGIIDFGNDPNMIWAIHNQGANAQRLVKINLKTGEEEVVIEDKEYDVSGALVDEDRRVPLAVSFNKARLEWTILDDSVKADFEALAKVARGDYQVVSRTINDQTWVVAYNKDNGPVTWYLFDRASKKAELLFTNSVALESAKLAEVEPIEFTAKDGLKIRGYFTKPLGVEAKNLPCVLFVHGGPWARDSWGYSPNVQWLANRGYAVLQINFRGSTGYGKNFLNAGNKEWAAKMHQDLLDGIEVYVKNGTIDPKRIAIMGGSYGGYATLVGLTFTPDVFCCGVDIVGPSNIVTLLKSIPPYWAPMKAVFNKRVGDIDTDASFLESRSPLNKVDKIIKPLLIAQGANDPRVKQAESDQIVAAMRKNKQQVEYVVYPDEGHGFQRPENRMHFFAIAEQFLAKHVGGRAEPLGDMKGHTGQMK